MKSSPFAVLATVLLLMAGLQLILAPYASGPQGSTALTSSAKMNYDDRSGLDRVASVRYDDSSATSGNSWTSSSRRGSVRFVRHGMGRRSRAYTEALPAHDENKWRGELPAGTDLFHFEVFSEMLARSAMLHVSGVGAKTENGHTFKLPVLLQGGDEFARNETFRLDRLPDVDESPIEKSQTETPLVDRALASIGRAALTSIDYAAKQVLLSLAAKLDVGGTTLKDIASHLASAAGGAEGETSEEEKLVDRSSPRILPQPSFIQ